MSIQRIVLPFILLVSLAVTSLTAQHGHDHHKHEAPASAHPTKTDSLHPTGQEAPAVAPTHEVQHTATEGHGAAGHAGGPCHHEEKPFNAGESALHHIADANAIHIMGDVYFHLPCFLYAPSQGWTFTSTAAFKAHHHGNGTVSKDGYVLAHGNVMRIADQSFPKGEQAIECIYTVEAENAKGKKVETFYALSGGVPYKLDKKTSYDGGLMGGGITSFSDFSITRNVFSMLLAAVGLFFLFLSVAKSMAKRAGLAPKGLQNFIEPFVTFVRDEIAKPNLGKHYEKYLPYLLTAFFFILGLNLFGQIPFFPGSANVTGSLSLTLVLALITFFIMLKNSNKHFWEHTLWMPGVPAALKILILTPVEILGLFLKPFTLLLRLFANITAGHIVILSFVSLIFIFGKAGASVGGTGVGLAISIPLSLFMMCLEFLVAFLQAYIFTMLSAVYIGSAIEEAHH